MTVKNLFTTEAKLDLRRLNNGRLCPNDLYFFLKSEKGGIDLTPATPVVTITGGGGGIRGLADTIDGKYSVIPPVVLTLCTTGQQYPFLHQILLLDNLHFYMSALYHSDKFLHTFCL